MSDPGNAVDIKIESSFDDEAVEVCFEPLGTTYALRPGEHIYVRVPLNIISGVDVKVWQGGISVELEPYPGDYSILDSSKNLLEHL